MNLLIATYQNRAFKISYICRWTWVKRWKEKERKNPLLNEIDQRPLSLHLRCSKILKIVHDIISIYAVVKHINFIVKFFLTFFSFFFIFTSPYHHASYFLQAHPVLSFRDVVNESFQFFFPKCYRGVILHGIRCWDMDRYTEAACIMMRWGYMLQFQKI